MPDYEDHHTVINLLERSQQADDDMRQAARDAHLFVSKRDGQWEPYWYNLCKTMGKPRYTFDMTTPILNQVAGELEHADFNIQVRPSGGEATKEIARTYDGLIRNIENICNATDIFNAAARNMITCGLDGWAVRSTFVDDESFNQDLIIERVPNFIDRVWFDDNSERQDRSDSKWGFLMHVLTLDAYKERFGDQRQDGPPSAQSVPQNQRNSAFWRKPSDQVVIAEFYYEVEETKDIALMSNGQVYEIDDDFNKVEDELSRLGVTRKRTRKVKSSRFYVRKMDGAGWLGEAQRTVFQQIPIVPTYGNFKIFDNKIIYHGIVEKLLDPQRVLNYSKSREIEEGALAPRSKYWMTQAQAAGHESSLQTMNTNNSPVQFFNPDPELPGAPQQNGGAAINPGLNNLSETMVSYIQQQAGLYDANMGNNPGLQSGVALEKLQNKGDNSTVHYFSAQEVAICQTAKLLIDAIPEVYDAERQIRILNEDGSFEMVSLNQPIRDEQSGDIVMLNDLSQGKYDVTCNAGPAFKNRQDQTLSTMLEVAQLMPETLQQGADIIFHAMDDPSADLMAERVRLQLFEQGLIPEEQMTDEERQKLAAVANKPPPPDPMMVAAQAEMQKAEAEMLKVQLQQQKNQIDGAKIQLQAQAAQVKALTDQQKLELAEQKEYLDGQVKQLKELRESESHDSAMIREAAETLKVLREAIGAEGVITPQAIKAYVEQAEIVESQQAGL